MVSGQSHSETAETLHPQIFSTSGDTFRLDYPIPQGVNFPHIRAKVVADVVKRVAIPPRTPNADGKYLVAIREGGHISHALVKIQPPGTHGVRLYRQGTPDDHRWDIFFPIDDSMGVKHVANAKHWEPNAANNGWLFFPCTEAEHHDFEDAVASAMLTAFQPHIDAAMAAAFRATDPFQRITTGKALDNLLEYRNDCLAEARRAHRASERGYFIYESLSAHEAAARAFKSVSDDWKEIPAQAAKQADTSVELGKVSRLLNDYPKPKHPAAPETEEGESENGD